LIKRIPNRPIGLTQWAELANSLNQLALHRLESTRVRASRYTFSALDALSRLGYVSQFHLVEQNFFYCVFRVSLRLGAGVPVASSFRAVGSGLGKSPVLISNLAKTYHSDRFRNVDLLGFLQTPGGSAGSVVALSELHELGPWAKSGLFSAHLEIAYC
jgi:hypothetical protein